MEWVEIDLYTTSQGLEAVCAMLMDQGITGMQIEDKADMLNFIEHNPLNWDYVDEALLNETEGPVYVKFYVSGTPAGRETLESIRQAVNRLKKEDIGIDLGSLELRQKDVDDSDWVDNWKKYYKPLAVGKNIVVKPEWEAYDNKDNKIIFNINPGHVFGTGLHQTTQLSIEQIEQHLKKGDRVLDLGCGTGILSIISLLLGASSAVAVDIEPDAVDIAYENAEKNGVDRNCYTVYSGNVLTDNALREKIRSAPYDMVIANIVADVIMGLMPFAYENLVSGGLFITSGIITERVLEVRSALENVGFQILGETRKDDWVCLLASKAAKA